MQSDHTPPPLQHAFDATHAARWLIATATEADEISVEHAAGRVVAVELLGLQQVKRNVGEIDAAIERLRERISRLEAKIAEVRAALEAAKAFGSQGETHEGVSVSYLIDNAIKSVLGDCK